jgi:hypothetical protein
MEPILFVCLVWVLAHAGRGVEGLGHRDEADAVRVEELDELREVGLTVIAAPP